MRTVLARAAAALTVAALVAAGAGCGAEEAGGDGRPHIVVTTSILGDVVADLVGDDAIVEVIMPPGSNPHDFAPSAKQAVAMRDAEVLVVSGAGFEAGLTDTIEAARADGAIVVTASAGDPHFFTDPVLMSEAVGRIATTLAEEVDELATPAAGRRAEAYQARLADLDAAVAEILSAVPEDRRLLVTNHDVFGPFAARYRLTVMGVIIPGGSNLAEPSAATLHSLAKEIHAAGVPAVFADTSSPARLAEALAAEGSAVDVVELYSESLGEAGSGAATYIDMVRTNAERIADALT